MPVIPDAPSKSQLYARHAPGVSKRLESATVGIAGLGGLGSNVAIALARSGIGRLILADFDRVEPSNLNRQAYFVDQIGKLKTEALRETLERVNPHVIFETHVVRIDAQNAETLFAGVDVLVEALDRPEEKALLLRAFSAAPIVAASGMAGYGPLDAIRIRKVGRRLHVVGDFESDAETLGVMAPRVGIVAHAQANLVLRLLMEGTP